jgi:hypothetical protein
MALKNIFLIKKNGAVFAFLFFIGFHYLFNPSESVGSPLMAALIRIIAAGVVLFSLFLIYVPKRTFVNLTYVYFFICIWFVLNNFPENASALFLIFLFIGIGLLVSVYIFSDYGIESGLVSRVLDYLLFFWVFSLLLQVSIYFLTAQVIDFHNWLHPLSEARINGVGLFVRFTGVLIEPGTYANWVYGVVVLRGISGKKMFDRLSLLSILSILMTMSAWGAMAVGVYMIAYISKNMTSGSRRMFRQKIVWIFILLAVSSAIYFQFFTEFGEGINYLTDRSELADGSGVAKVQAYQGFFNLFTRIFFFGFPVNYDFCNGCLSPQDAGIFVNLAVRGGVVFALIVFFVIGNSVFKSYGLISCICIFPLVVAKYYYFEPLFWALFGFCFLDVIKIHGRGRAGRVVF